MKASESRRTELRVELRVKASQPNSVLHCLAIKTSDGRLVVLKYLLTETAWLESVKNMLNVRLIQTYLPRYFKILVLFMQMVKYSYLWTEKGKPFILDKNPANSFGSLFPNFWLFF